MNSVKPTTEGWFIVKVIAKNACSEESERYMSDVYADGNWLYCGNFGAMVIEIVRKCDLDESYTDIKNEVHELNLFKKRKAEINLHYTKSQKDLVGKFESMFGKSYNKESLTKEINKIVTRPMWTAEHLPNGVCVYVDTLGISFNLIFKYVNNNKKSYKLDEIKYL